MIGLNFDEESRASFYTVYFCKWEIVRQEVLRTVCVKVLQLTLVLVTAALENYIFLTFTLLVLFRLFISFGSISEIVNVAV